MAGLANVAGLQVQSRLQKPTSRPEGITIAISPAASPKTGIFFHWLLWLRFRCLYRRRIYAGLSVGLCLSWRPFSTDKRNLYRFTLENSARLSLSMRACFSRRFREGPILLFRRLGTAFAVTPLNPTLLPDPSLWLSACPLSSRLPVSVRSFPPYDRPADYSARLIGNRRGPFCNRLAV
jgi:hypothetical protein